VIDSSKFDIYGDGRKAVYNLWLMIRAKSQEAREEAMRKTYISAAVLILLVTAGCNHYGALNEDYGKSFSMMKSGQTLNPEASNNQKPVTGLSGSAADLNMKKYTSSFAPSNQTQQQAPQGIYMMPSSSAGTTGQ
jgi:hypothetical protein